MGTLSSTMGRNLCKMSSARPKPSLRYLIQLLGDTHYNRICQLVIAILADRGLLKYEQLVSDIWPEYAQKGKENTTIVHVTRHEAGLPVFDGYIDVLDLSTDRIKQGSVSKFIAEQTPKSPPGERRDYHALTRGWILNEIVRRVDPKGRTIGEFLREEISTPLGLQEELYLGIDEEDHAKIAPLTGRSLAWTYQQLVLPKFAGNLVHPIFDVQINMKVAGQSILNHT